MQRRRFLALAAALLGQGLFAQDLIAQTLPAGGDWSKTLMRPMGAFFDPSLGPVSYNVAERMRSYGVPGVSLAVAASGRLLFETGFGHCLQGREQGVDAQTCFQAAGLSRPVAAAAALRLSEDGVLDTRRALSAELPSPRLVVPRGIASREPTILELLAHTGGINLPEYPGYAPHAAMPSLAQSLLGRDPATTVPVALKREPGQRFAESGGGYSLLEAAMAAQSRQGLEDIAAHLVFAPCGMKHSSFVQPLSAQPGLALGHEASGDPQKGDFRRFPEKAAAGLWTTAGDLVRFGLALSQSWRFMPGSLLTPGTARDMLSAKVDLACRSMGLGFFVIGGAGDPMAFYTGQNEGYAALMCLWPNSGEVVAVMCNSGGGLGLCEEFAYSVAQARDWPLARPRAVPGILRIELPASVAGRYVREGDDADVITLVKERGAVVGLRRGRQPKVFDIFAWGSMEMAYADWPYPAFLRIETDSTMRPVSLLVSRCFDETAVYRLSA